MKITSSVLFLHARSGDALFSFVPAIEKIGTEAADRVDGGGQPESGGTDILDLPTEKRRADQVRHIAQHGAGDIGRERQPGAAEKSEGLREFDFP